MKKIVQCWDDGVTSDIRLIEVLRRHGAKASFNLNPGLHPRGEKAGGWKSGDREIRRLDHDMLVETYQGFTIANHTLTHPHLTKLSPAEIKREISEGRDQLQQLFQQPVRGFAYPFGNYDEEVMELLRASGHAYGRTVMNIKQPFPPGDPMAFHPTCHFLAEDFKKRYDMTEPDGVFYFWGHSFELHEEQDWAVFDEMIGWISADPAAQWYSLEDLF
ncbi:MAG: polysaccharide deacetylase family protein [Kiritimatiellia bacterium]